MFNLCSAFFMVRFGGQTLFTVCSSPRQSKVPYSHCVQTLFILKFQIPTLFKLCSNLVQCAVDWIASKIKFILCSHCSKFELCSNFSCSFGLKNHLSFGFRFPALQKVQKWVHRIWFITDTSNFRLVCPLEFPCMVPATSLI